MRAVEIAAGLLFSGIFNRDAEARRIDGGVAPRLCRTGLSAANSIAALRISSFDFHHHVAVFRCLA